MSLRLLSHPLPVAWDGREVKWSRWDSTDRIIICPPPKSRCECGSNRAPFVAVGLRAADAGPGRFQRRYALRDLHAVRCPDCGQVDVWDMDSDGWWTLDESDYGPDGSTPPPEWAGGLFDLLNAPSYRGVPRLRSRPRYSARTTPGGRKDVDERQQVLMRCECGHAQAWHVHGEHACTKCFCKHYRGES